MSKTESPSLRSICFSLCHLGSTAFASFEALPLRNQRLQAALDEAPPSLNKADTSQAIDPLTGGNLLLHAQAKAEAMQVLQQTEATLQALPLQGTCQLLTWLPGTLGPVTGTGPVTGGGVGEHLPWRPRSLSWSPGRARGF